MRQWKGERDDEAERAEVYGQLVRALIGLRCPYAETREGRFPQHFTYQPEDSVEQIREAKMYQDINCKELGAE